MEAERAVHLSELPPILTFHLKRYSGSTGEKLSHVVHCPAVFRVGQWCSDDCKQRNCIYGMKGCDYSFIRIISC